MSKTIFDQFLFEIQAEMTVGELLELYKKEIHESLEKEVFADVVQSIMTEKKEELYQEFRERLMNEEMITDIPKVKIHPTEGLNIDPNLGFQKEVK